MKAGIPLLSKKDVALWRAKRDPARRTVASKHEAYANAAAINRVDLMRELTLSQLVLDNINHVIASHQLINESPEPSVVDIGLVVTVQHYDYDDVKIGTPKTFLIGTYGSSDLNTSPPVYSYESRVVLDLLGHKVGDDCASFCGKEHTTVEILAIRRQNEPPSLLESGQVLKGTPSLSVA